MDKKEWVEHGQRFRWEGWYIRTTKPAKLKVSYGDERLREIREERARTQRPGRFRMLSRIRGALAS